MSIVVGVLAAILSFGFIIFVHELGHFLAARWAGIRCPQFAIGFGPKMFAFDWRATEFSLRAFPVGGYVLMVGEDPQMDGGDSWHEQFLAATGPLNLPTTPASVLANMAAPDPEVTAFLSSLPQERVYHQMEDLEGNFNAKSTWQKTVVIMGGVFMNYVTAILLLLGLGLSVGLCSGQPEHLARAKVVMPGSPAERAGLKANENMVAVDGVSVVSGTDFIQQMSGKVGQLVRVTVEDKSGQRHDLQMAPDLMLANQFVFGQGKGVELTKLRDGSTPPKGIRLPYQIATINGKPVTELTELRSWALNSKELLLGGPQGEWKIDSGKAHTFGPRAIVGIELANIVAFQFETKATGKVLEVRTGSQAARAGLKAGDELYELQGVLVASGQGQLEECLRNLSQRQAAADGSFKLTVLRDDKFKDLFMEEVPLPTAQEWGVQLEPLTASVVVRSTSRLMLNVVSFPYQLFKDMVKDAHSTVQDLKENSSGPIGIVQTMIEGSHAGLGVLIFLVGVINASIATFNLLPFPALDGSRLLFIWLGALRGRAIDPQKEARIHFAGILLLLCLIFLRSIGDVQRWYSGIHMIK
jgi:RIP metalloprotease RseP